jgi:hypothetical protein
VFHEVCPLSGVDVYALLVRRGYIPVELSTVHYQPIDAATRIASNPALHVRQAQPHEAEKYGTVAAQGWSEHPEVMPYIQGFAKLSLACATCFFAERDGEPIATAALFMHNGTALLAGASTVPAGRRQGAQNALLDARLHTAASNGCDLAMMVPRRAAPRSATPSARDSESLTPARNGCWTREDVRFRRIFVGLQEIGPLLGSNAGREILEPAFSADSY